MRSTSREQERTQGVRFRQTRLLEACLKPQGVGDLKRWDKGLRGEGERGEGVWGTGQWGDRFSGIRDQEGAWESLRWEGSTPGVRVGGEGLHSLQVGDGLPGVEGGWTPAVQGEGKSSGVLTKGEGIPESFQSTEAFQEEEGSRLWGEDLLGGWDGDAGSWVPQARMCAARVHSTPEAQGDLLLDEQEVHLQKGDAQGEPGRTGDDERVGDEVEEARLPPQALSFSGSGFLVAYHVGVVECLLVNVPEVVHGARRVFGASAGSLIAAAVVCGIDLDHFYQSINRAAKQSRRRFLGLMNPLFNPLQIVRKGLVENLCENAYELACGRLVISMTRASDGQNVLVSDFSSNEELIQALLCSCFIPVYCGLIPPTFRGVMLLDLLSPSSRSFVAPYYIDGGLTNSQPLYDKKNTITISPFAGEIDICPRGFADCFFFYFANCSFAFTPENMHRVTVALFPPHSKVLQRFFWNGYGDTLLYLLANKLLSLVNQKTSVIGTFCSLASHPIHNVTSVGQRVSRWFLHVPEALGLMFKHDDRGTRESQNVFDTRGGHSAHRVFTGSV